jgi:hypothetical protein
LLLSVLEDAARIRRRQPALTDCDLFRRIIQNQQAAREARGAQYAARHVSPLEHSTDRGNRRDYPSQRGIADLQLCDPHRAADVFFRSRS